MIFVKQMSLYIPYVIELAYFNHFKYIIEHLRRV